jgi:hypothetical protein
MARKKNGLLRRCRPFFCEQKNTLPFGKVLLAPLIVFTEVARPPGRIACLSDTAVMTMRRLGSYSPC